MDWWIWLVVGLGLLGAEVVLPGGFFLMFFGFGAIVVGLLAFPGLAGPLWAQLGLFALISAGSLMLLRRRMIESMKPAAGTDEKLADLVGAAVVVSADAPPHGRGTADYRGAPWSIFNAGDAPLAKGQRAKVLGVDGLTLRVTKE
ncbi:MAG: NfeD family protein [Elusimicrobia bacterium]|nr:NfeD family protein [Elusimicrobiota bacterium]